MKLALAGDTMLGRAVAQELGRRRPESLVDRAIVEITRAADVFVLNLECCISERGEPLPEKKFTFRAPPAAIEVLHDLGVDCVTLANNHAVDYGLDALLDTLAYLRDSGIACAGAGEDVEEACSPVVVRGLPIVAFADHEPGFAAGPNRPGIAFTDLLEGVPAWLRECAPGALICPHWGPNMEPVPVPHVRSAARELREAGAALVAGTSAHVFQGVEGDVLYDVGDFLDDYARDPVLRNDFGLLFLVELEPDGPRRIEAVPLKLDYAFTRLARGDEADWIRKRFQKACAELGTEVLEDDGRLVIAAR
jgi:poly-gamma-glutamate capsule biosynthesis protein CapA/YwtB (metallophosphatase superfamily)